MLKHKRWFQLSLVGLWIVSVLFFVRLLWVDTSRGYPYESWDEIATYNSAVSIWTEASGRVYSYGGLNTLQQVLANWIYQRFDPIGREHPPIRYSNNAPASFLDPDLGSKAKTWKGMDHAYFRGLTDHRPIFLSRKIHLIVFALLFLGLGAFLIWREARSGALASLIFLSFLPSAEVLDGVEKALPGLQNSILILFVLLMAGEAVRKLNVRWLLGAIVVYGIGLNIKIDTLALLAPLGCVSLYLAFRLKQSWSQRLWLLSGIGAFVVLAFFAFRVSMWLRGHPELTPQFYTLKGFSGGHVDFRANLRVFEDLTRSNGVVPFKGFLPFPSGLLIFLGMIGALIAGFFALGEPEFLLFGGTSILLWSLIIFRATSVGLQTRYFLYSFVLCQFGVAWLIGKLALSVRQRVRAFAFILVFAFCAVTTHSALSLESRIFDGMDSHHNYNVATEKVLNLLGTGQFDRRVLVDQHSYLDLRRFRERGIEPILINMFNYEKVLGQFAQSSSSLSRPVLVLFSPGVIHQWNDNYSGPDWDADEKANYAAYESRMLGFGLIESVGTGKRELLDPGPVSAVSPIEIRRWDPAS